MEDQNVQQNLEDQNAQHDPEDQNVQHYVGTQNIQQNPDIQNPGTPAADSASEHSVEPKQEQQTTPSPTPSPVPPMVLWRQALQSQPEWATLPDDVQCAIEHKLKNTSFRAEPSGHTTWKTVKAMLKEGQQPDMVSLITATYIWRIRRTRPGLAPIVGLPDSFETEAGFHDPPVNIWNWPHRDMPWKSEGAGEVKVEESNTPPYNTGIGGQAAAGSSSHLGTVVKEESARPAAKSGSAGAKRGRTGDDDPTTARPTKRTTLPSRAPAARQGTPAQLNEWKGRFAAADAKLGAANSKIAGLTKELDETKEKLVEGERRLDEMGGKVEEMQKTQNQTNAELTELRAIALGNRGTLRRAVTCLGEGTRTVQSALSKMAKDLKRLEENLS